MRDPRKVLRQAMHQAMVSRVVASQSRRATSVPPPSGFLEGSIYKDVLYAGTNHSFTPGETMSPSVGSGEYGIYLTPKRQYARGYGSRLYQVFVNFRNPLYVRDKSEISPKDLTREDIQRLKKQGYDAIVSNSRGNRVADADEVVLFDSKQTFIFQGR